MLPAHWRDGARALKRQALTVWFVARHPRLPWPLRLVALAVAGYAFSPIDLIPDFIPVLGLLDDLLVVPLGVWLVVKLAPPELLTQARAQAEAAAVRPVSRRAAWAIALIWAMLAAASGWWVWRRVTG